jgi:hypothetical protein
MKSFIQHLQERSLLAPMMLSAALGAGAPPEVAPSTTETETKQKEATQPAPYKIPDNIAPLYAATVRAEHSGLGLTKPEDLTSFNEKMYIRTAARPKNPKEVSTAYGPLQLTKGLVAGSFGKKQNKDLYADIGDFTGSFINQGKTMLTKGLNDPTYGAGCKGDFCDPKYHENYQKLGTAVIRGELRELGIDDTKPISQADAMRFHQYHRFGPKGGNDPRYFKQIEAHYKENPLQ